MADTLRTLQLTQLEILKKIDQVCRKHQIPYSLYAGTLLGAVRHGGFIPWDDDLDLCMARADYERFLSVWEREPHEGYLLQNKENAPGFTQSFTKIRKDHTTFLQSEAEAGQYHTGIFVDIFPIDRMPRGRLAAAVFKLRCMVYQLYTREFVPPEASRPVQWSCGLLLRLVPPRRRGALRQRLLRDITRYDREPGLRTAAIETMASLRRTFPPDMLDAYTELPFEDGRFLCFAGWDAHLRCKFGDYMQLPPESERAWKHHPVILDFHRNYEELPQNERSKVR